MCWGGSDEKEEKKPEEKKTDSSSKKSSEVSSDKSSKTASSSASKKSGSKTTATEIKKIDDYFVLVKWYYYAIFLFLYAFLGLLSVMCLKPEICEAIPLVRDATAETSLFFSMLFWILFVTNLMYTILVINECRKQKLNAKTTMKWLGQTIITGFYSYKLIKEK